MRKSVSLLARLSIAAVFAAGISLAAPQDVVRVHLPYTMLVDGKTLPPGDYEIEDLDSSTDLITLVMRSKTEAVAIAVRRIDTDDDRDGSKTELVLDHRGEQLVFGKLLVEGRPYYYAVP